MLLNICDVIWVCVPVDLSILVIWRILPVFCDTVTVFSDLFAMICENKVSKLVSDDVAFSNKSLKIIKWKIRNRKSNHEE